MVSKMDGWMDSVSLKYRKVYGWMISVSLR